VTGVLVVAEVGANHGGSVDDAHVMLEQLAVVGAQCVKFQVYKADDLVADGGRMVTWGHGARIVTEPLGAMFDRLSLPWTAFDGLFAHARSLGMEPFGTPFSEAGIARLVELGSTRIKVASSDVGHVALLRECAATGLPVILSLGKSTLAEADRAVETLAGAGCTDLTLLHCVATYPAQVEEANLRVITTLQHAFPQCTIGYSDHTQGRVAAIAAVALGARVIERHVTLDPTRPGPDEWFSLPIAEFGAFSTEIQQTRASLGDGRKVITPSEEPGRANGTRSLVAARDLTAGHVLEEADIKVVRPGTGLPPALLKAVLGMAVTVDVRRNTPLTWQFFKA
jgi:sialic acid synthase SpsE